MKSISIIGAGALLVMFVGLAFANPPRVAEGRAAEAILAARFGPGPIGTINAVNSTPTTGVSVAGQSVEIAVPQVCNSVTVQVSGTWSATLLGQLSIDGGQTWTTLTGTPFTAVGATGAWASGTNGLWTVSGTNSSLFRITCSAYTSGTANVAMWTSGAGGSGGSSSTVTANAGTNLNTSALALESGGNLATIATNTGASVSAIGSAVPSKGIYNGGIATTAIPSNATAGNLVGAMFDKAGRMVVAPQAPRDLVKHQATTITSSTASTTVVTAGASGVFNDVTSIVFTNSSSTATVVTLSDGTASYTYIVPPTDMRGVAYPVPLAETTAATAWTVTCTTSVASIIVDACYVTNK